MKSMCFSARASMAKWPPCYRLLSYRSHFFCFHFSPSVTDSYIYDYFQEYIPVARVRHACISALIQQVYELSTKKLQLNEFTTQDIEEHLGSLYKQCKDAFKGWEFLVITPQTLMFLLSIFLNCTCRLSMPSFACCVMSCSMKTPVRTRIKKWKRVLAGGWAIKKAIRFHSFKPVVTWQCFLGSKSIH